MFNFNYGGHAQVIPPGMEFHHIAPHDGDLDGEDEKSEENPSSHDPAIWSEVLVNLSYMHTSYQ